MSTPAAIAALTAAFDATVVHRGQAAGIDGSAAVVSWPSVPAEVIRAAGLRPFVVRGAARATPAADAHLEAGIFPGRLRQLVEAALTGQLAAAACVILPRTSDADYKCFLYLRELVRRGVVRTLPPVLLFDLLQSPGPEVRAYDAARVRALADTLGSLTGRHPSLDDLRGEIVRANGARAARRRLLALRRGAPRVRGTEAVPLLGAYWHVAPDDYAALAGEAAHVCAARPPLERPRVLLTGAPVDGPALHAAIESAGAVVVAEAGPWGGGAWAHDVDSGGDPWMALADAYRAGVPGPRTPVEEVRRWTARALDEVDAVVVSLPPDDTTFGWDYPALRDELASRRMPHAVLHNDPDHPVPDADRARLVSLAAAAAPREARPV